MNNNIFQHNSSCVLGVTFSLTLEKAMVGDLGESLCLKKYWFCSLRKETLVSYYKTIQDIMRGISFLQYESDLLVFFQARIL